MSIAGKASQFYSGFTPQSLTGCILWLDAADPNGNGILPANGSSITTWIDKSSNSNHATAGNAPVITYNYQNGRPAIVFNGTSTFLRLPGIRINQITIYMVAKYNVNQANTFCIALGPSAIMLRQPFTGGNFQVDGTFTTYGVYSSTVQDTSYHIWSFGVPTNAAGFFNLDGTLMSSSGFSGPASDTDVSSNTIGAWNQQINGNLNGAISEILFYNVYHTSPQARQVEGYLASKWGLGARLPLGHPYKTIPPFLRTFHPLDFSNCALWLDAADQGTITLSGNTLTGWTDKSGNSRSITINSAPTYSTTGFNGRPAMVFTLGNRITTTTASALGQNATMAVVFRVTSLGSANGVGVAGILSVGGVGTDYAIHFRNDFGTYATYSPSAGGTGNDFYTAINTDIAAVAVMNTATPYWVLTLNGNNKINSGLGGYNTAPSSLTNTAVELAGGTWSTGNFGGSIAEVIIFSNSLTTAQRQQLEGYLTQKWGLRGNLPANHTFRLYSPLALPFTPRQISGCSLWLDAADLSTITLSGSNVTQWSDKSGSGLTAISNSIYAGVSLPTYSSSPFVQFDTSQALVVSNFSYTTAWTCFVCMNTVTLADRWLISPFNDMELVMMSMGSVLSTFGKIFNNKLPSANVDVSGAHIEVTMASNTNATAPYFWFRDGTPVTSNTTGNTLAARTTRLGIGANAAVSDKMSGTYRIYEIILYSSMLSSNQRQQVEGYLAQKWNLRSGLPSTHGFKTIAA